MGRLDMFDDFPGLRDRPQGGQQRLRRIDREPERLEELGLPTIIWMSRIQQVVDDLVSFDDGEMRASQFHQAEAILPRARDSRLAGLSAGGLRMARGSLE